MLHCVYMFYNNPLHVVIMMAGVGAISVRSERFRSYLVNCIIWMMLTLKRK